MRELFCLASTYAATARHSSLRFSFASRIFSSTFLRLRIASADASTSLICTMWSAIEPARPRVEFTT
jgi:hypothetical protein